MKILGVGNTESEKLESGGIQAKTEYRFDLIPAKAHFALARTLHLGFEKYGDNAKLIPIESHLNHAMLHIISYLAGDSSEAHLAHAFTRLAFAIEQSDEKLEEVLP